MSNSELGREVFMRGDAARDGVLATRIATPSSQWIFTAGSLPFARRSRTMLSCQRPTGRLPPSLDLGECGEATVQGRC